MNELPTGWRRTEFGGLFDIAGGGQPSKRHFVYKPRKDYVRLLQIRDFGNAPKPTYVPRGKVSKFCEEEDILIARYGASVGRILSGLAGAYNVALVKLLFNKKHVNKKFAYYWLTSEAFQKRVQSTSRSAQSGFNKDDLFPIIIYLPPLGEQVKIAAILTTWDNAITTIEQLIEALERRKKGLMQRLLLVPKDEAEPQVRFPGFTEPWQWQALSDVFVRVKRKNDEGNENVLTASGQFGLVSQTEYFNRSVASANLENYYLLRRGEFAYNRSSSDGYPYGAIKQLTDYDSGVLSTLYICFGLADEASDPTYFKHFFEAGGLNQGIYAIAQEGARNHGLLNVSLSDFFSLPIPVPPLEEQRRLAEFFELQDQLIATVRQYHERLLEQKKGLMQRLLTGQVRVQPDEVPTEMAI